MTSLARRLITANKQQTQVKTRSRTKFKLKSSVIAVYASTFVLIISMVFIGYHQPQGSSALATSSNAYSTSQIDQTSVDNVIATDLAANIAQAANLPIATSVSNLAISAKVKGEFVQSDANGVAKPQLIESNNNNRTVISYTVKAGDSVDSVAAENGISKNTIKWANNLTSDTLIVGSVLKILPFDGVLHAVKAGDTIDSIAAKYKVDKTRLILLNDLETSGLVQNTSILLPEAELPTNERPGYVAPPVVNTFTFFYAGRGAGLGGDTWFIAYGTPDDGHYTHGNCTLYAANRRRQLGLGVGDFWGNAGSWAQSARNDGYTVNGTPSVGAIIQDWGHVAIVEKVLQNGDLEISEMNAYVPGGGYNIVSGRIVPAGNIGQYLYIH